MGAGIDGRASYPNVFHSENDDRPLTPLKLIDIKSYDSGAVLIRYKIIKKLMNKNLRRI